MHGFRTFRGVSLGALVAAALLPGAALAQSTTYTTPNITTAEGATQASLNGVIFTNKGLVGAGRLDANAIDFRGETMGSFSGMALDLGTWGRNADGSYRGNIFTLPDRGPFDGAIDYRNRVHTSSITLRTLTGTAALPQVAASQNQLTITPTGGFTLKDATGLEMTGRDPAGSTVTRNGIVYPLATLGTAAGHISLDAEAIAFRPDGTFYVSDEYAAGVYYFDAAGKQIGAIQAPAALLPRTAGVINFNSTTPGQTGRRNNQGLEAMTITPDNKRLATILQSATVQDTNGAAQQTRNNTRILVYDISSGATPANPIGHYVLQLPVFNNNGTGAAADRTAAQSEMLALNDTQFLVLSRDGVGRGTAANASTSITPLYKSVLLVDTAQATNLAGTAYETGTTPVATNGVLAAGIKAVQQVELVNMLNPVQLARVGMNLTRLPRSTLTTLSEKQEAMALAPVLEENAPHDFFLFIGNDNDFQGTNIVFNGVASTSGALDGTGNNDSVLLVYRLTLPTYVDPLALAAIHATAPNVLYGTRMALNGLAQTANQPAMTWLGVQRQWTGETGRPAMQLWLDGGWNRHGRGASTLSRLDAETHGGTLGLDMMLGADAHIGAFGGYRQLDGTLDGNAPLRADGWTAGLYAAARLPLGLYVQASGAWLGDIALDSVGRTSVYGQQATGSTSAEGWAASAEAGFTLPAGSLTVTPFARIDFSDLDLAGYAEQGASVSNMTFAARSFERVSASFGGELAARLGAFRPTLRAGYTMEDERGDSATTVRLSNAQHAMGTVVLPLARTERDSAFAEARLGMTAGPFTAFMAGGGRWGRGADEASASVGLSWGF